MKLHKEIVKAINKATEEYGSKKEFAHKIGIDIGAFYYVVSYKKQEISDEIYDRLYPLIKEHLPHDIKYISRIELERCYDGKMINKRSDYEKEWRIINDDIKEQLNKTLSKIVNDTMNRYEK